MGFISKSIELDWEGFQKNLLRKGTPSRVFFFEHGITDTIQQSVEQEYGLWDKLNPSSPDFALRKPVEIHRFFGLELMRVYPSNARMIGPSLGQDRRAVVASETPVNLNHFINSWEDFEKFNWPSAAAADFSVLEYYEKNLPENMRTFGVVDLWEIVRALMGFENLCYALYDDPELVREVIKEVAEFYLSIIRSYCDFDCHAVVYLADDLGSKTSTMLAPSTFREILLPWHKKMAELAHEKGKYFFFHSCGQMYQLIDDYIDEVRIDAKHSFEDDVLPVTEAKRQYGNRLSLLGGVDVDLLARSSESIIRSRTREILDICVPGGGYFLGCGNWVMDYIPLKSYLAMLDEGRNWI